MKAVYLTEHGAIDVLTYGELPDPVPSEGEVLVRVRACGVNHVDLWVRRGLPFLKVPFPFVPGGDIAGEVVAVGPATESLSLGTRVLVNPGVSCGRCERCLSGRDNLCAHFRVFGEHLPGGYAEFVNVPAENLVPLPLDLSFVTAACLPGVFITTWNMIFDQAKLAPGEWILIHAGEAGSAAPPSSWRGWWEPTSSRRRGATRRWRRRSRWARTTASTTRPTTSFARSAASRRSGAWTC